MQYLSIVLYHILYVIEIVTHFWVGSRHNIELPQYCPHESKDHRLYRHTRMTPNEKINKQYIA